MGLHLRDTGDSEYLMIVNAPELYRRARDLRYRNVILMEDDSLDERDVQWIKSQNKFPLFLLFVRQNSDLDDKIYELMERAGTECLVQNIRYDWSLYGNNHIDTIEDAVRFFPRKYYIERELEAQGAIHNSLFKTTCGNCGAFFGEYDKYCQYCGAKRGEGAYSPDEDVMEVLYGPPIKYRLRCTNCDHVWEDTSIGSNRSKYCPECGKMMVEIEDETDLWSRKIYDYVFQKNGVGGDNDD